MQAPNALLRAPALSTDQEYRDNLLAFMLANNQHSTYQADLHPLLSHAPCTDVGNAIRLFARYGLNLKYVVDVGYWYVWNGRLWRKDEGEILITDHVKKMTGMIIEEARAIAPLPLTDEQASQLTSDQTARRDEAAKRSQRLMKWADAAQSKNRLMAAIELLKSEPGVSVMERDLDADDTLLSFPNGTLELPTLEFRQPKREDLITKCTGADYQPGATCPTWDAFMGKVASVRESPTDPYQPRPELERYIRAMTGTGLYGKVLDQIMGIFHGSGGNGKSVWVEVVKEVMGDYAATATANLFEAKQTEGISNDIARLAGVRFLAASESEEGKPLAEALVKGLTGSEKRTARFLRKEFFEFTPKFTPILLTNYPPVIKGTDRGIWRRLKLVPWDYDFTEDPEREDVPTAISRLRVEASGIMNWLLAGLQDRLAVKSLEAIEPDVVKQATNRYKEDSDLLGQFLIECLIEEFGATITKDELYGLYQTHVKESGNNAMSKKTLGTKLQLRGWKDRKSTGGKRIWLGWRQRTETDNVNEEADSAAAAAAAAEIVEETF